MQAIRAQNEVADAFVSGQSRITNEYLLVRELAHRLNNEYASLIGLTSGIAARSSASEVKAALCEVTNLLHNYAGVHQALQMPTTVRPSMHLATFVHFANRLGGRGWTDEESSSCWLNHHFSYTPSNAGSSA
jgi:two-component sensor histidine kinase